MQKVQIRLIYRRVAKAQQYKTTKVTTFEGECEKTHTHTRTKKQKQNKAKQLAKVLDVFDLEKYESEALNRVLGEFYPKVRI